MTINFFIEARVLKFASFHSVNEFFWVYFCIVFLLIRSWMALVIYKYLIMLGRLSCFMTHSSLIARLLFCLYSSFGIQFCGPLLQLRAVFWVIHYLVFVIEFSILSPILLTYFLSRFHQVSDEFGLTALKNWVWCHPYTRFLICLLCNYILTCLDYLSRMVQFKRWKFDPFIFYLYAFEKRNDCLWIPGNCSA